MTCPTREELAEMRVLLSPDAREGFAASLRAVAAWERTHPTDIAGILDWVDQLRALFGDPPVDRSGWRRRRLPTLSALRLGAFPPPSGATGRAARRESAGEGPGPATTPEPPGSMRITWVARNSDGASFFSCRWSRSAMSPRSYTAS